jgi:AICARFT/IMPCHase bienzyme
MSLSAGLRYGENPHQPAAFYTDSSLSEFGRGGVANSVQLHGKEMSYNNYLDADAAYGAACDYAGGCCGLAASFAACSCLRGSRTCLCNDLDRPASHLDTCRTGAALRTKLCQDSRRGIVCRGVRPFCAETFLRLVSKT